MITKLIIMVIQQQQPQPTYNTQIHSNAYLPTTHTVPLASHQPDPVNYQPTCTTPQSDTYDHTNLHSYSQPGATDCQIVQADNRPRVSYQPVTSINPANLYNNAFQPIRQSVNQHLPYPVPVNDSRTKPPWTKPPGQNPPVKTPLDKTPRRTKPPRGQNPPRQNPPRQKSP